MTFMRVIGIIPARYGSSRFPGKPLALLQGRPLIQYVFEQARQAPGLDDLWVATDDPRIADCVQGFGGQVLLTRPDHPSGSDRLAEAAQILRLAPQDIVVNIQGDQPIFPRELIGRLAEPLRQSPQVMMVTPMRRVTDLEQGLNPNMVKVVFDQWGRALYFSRSLLPFWRDGGELYFYKHIGIYAYRVEFLQKFIRLPPGRWEEAEKLEQLRALEHGYPIHLVETAEDTVEVDTPEDLARAEAFLQGLGIRG